MPCGCVFVAYRGLAFISDGLPRTLRFEIDSWRNDSWGLHNIERRLSQCEVAVSSDGSRRNRCQEEGFKHYFLRYGAGSLHTLYQRPRNAGFRIEEKTRTAYGGDCPCRWDHPTMAADDGDCSKAAHWLPRGRKAGTGTIAGQHVVRYGRTEASGTETSLSLAPGLAREVMERLETSPGTFGIPGARRHYRVSSYTPGEPAPEVFQLPAGYAVKQDR